MRKSVIGGVAVAAIGVVIAACSSGTSDQSIEVTNGIVIRNATVVNTRDGSLTPQMAIVIDQGKILNITASAVRTSGTAQDIDAAGKYVVPGFLDMHVHSLGSADLPTTYWPLFIANGVTGIREMNGSAALIQRARKLNTDSAAGAVDAPEVLMIAGDLYRGQAPTAPLAVQFVQQQKAIGADFVKVVAGSSVSILAILGEAKNQGLTVAGHLVPAVSALDSSNAGWRAIEHLGAGTGGIGLDCSNAEAGIRPNLIAASANPPTLPATYVITPLLYTGAPTAPVFQTIYDTYSDSKCLSLAQAFVKNGTWHVPTLFRLRTMEYSDDPLYTADPNLKYVDTTTKALWAQLGQQYTATVPATAAATLRQFYSLHQKITKMMKQNGVKMLAGSDLGGIWVIPGFSLHQEFHELAASGLSPLEVLQMTTLNGAQFLNREATMGSVDVGKNADLVLLDANPIADVANLDTIAAVFVKGKYFSKVALDKLKSDVAAAYANQPVKTLSTALDPNHVH